MLSLISQSLLKKGPLKRLTSVINLATTSFPNSFTGQIEYITSVCQNTSLDWPSIKSNVLSQQGNINQKNFEGVLLKVLVNRGNYDAALSFANHLRSSGEEMTLGSINGILSLYYEIGKSRKLSEEEKTFIKDAYKTLYKKYNVLDCTTSEKLLLALCAIDEWEKSLWVLEDIHLTNVPSHITFSVLIGTLFRNNKKKKAFEIINESIKHKRPLRYEAFNEWINFIHRKYKDRKAVLKQLGEIHEHISRNYAVIDQDTANKLKDIYSSIGWDAEFTKIRKEKGECIKCYEKLDCLKLSDEDFLTLQQNVKEKLIVGSNLFLKSTPEELKRFIDFVEKTAPYDIVIDALNIAYAVGKSSSRDRMEFLFKTVDYFKQNKKRILLLGRKHMLRWGKGNIDRLTQNTCSFFTEDLSQDDPYFITAAILSGPHTDIVSKDLLRGHQFNLQDENLRYMFKKWQWQHQWMVFITNRGFKIQPPLPYTPCAQKNENHGGWHLPFQSETSKTVGLINDGTPDLSSWLCIRRKENK